MSVTKPIIVGYDPTTADHTPVEFGLAIARLTGARLIVASVQARPAGAAGRGRAPRRVAVVQAPTTTSSPTARRRSSARPGAGAAGRRSECRKLQGTSAARALHEAAEAEDAGLLVVGSSRRGAAGAGA